MRTSSSGSPRCPRGTSGRPRDGQEVTSPNQGCPLTHCGSRKDLSTWLAQSTACSGSLRLTRGSRCVTAVQQDEELPLLSHRIGSVSGVLWVTDADALQITKREVGNLAQQVPDVPCCVLQWWRLRRGVNTVTRSWCCVRCMVCAVVCLRGVSWVCRCGCVSCPSSGRSTGFGGPDVEWQHIPILQLCASLSLCRMLSVHTRCGSLRICS